MKRYYGKQKGPAGTYLNLANWEFVQVTGDGILPGKDEDRYFRVPSLLAVILGPFAGLAFVIFLPMIGIIGIDMAYRLDDLFEQRKGAWQPHFQMGTSF